MHNEKASDGIFCLEYGHELFYDIPASKGYEKYGYVGTTASGKNSRHDIVHIDGFEGQIDEVGGPYQMACYKVTIDGDGLVLNDDVRDEKIVSDGEGEVMVPLRIAKKKMNDLKTILSNGVNKKEKCLDKDQTQPDGEEEAMVPLRVVHKKMDDLKTILSDGVDSKKGCLKKHFSKLIAGDFDHTTLLATTEEITTALSDEEETVSDGKVMVPLRIAKQKMNDLNTIFSNGVEKKQKCLEKD